ncbi:MAG: phosphatase PAP2 family protein [Crocinitomicaceae bacterium]|nr:phosphatase PAP2 family protein [Crocinitomicaceae bacterium]
MKLLAQVLSYIFHPLLMPVLGLICIFFLPTFPRTLYIFDSLYFYPGEIKSKLFWVFGVLLFLAPLVSVLIMYWNKMISSLHLEKREERGYPFFIVTFYYLLTYIFFRYQWPEELRHPALVSLLFGLVVTGVVVLLINRYFKISIHAVASFGLAGLLLAYNQNQMSFYEKVSFPNIPVILATIVLAGIISTARLYLKSHTLSEILLGMIVGFGTMYACVKWELYL